jgi:hypothetical protein
MWMRHSSGGLAALLYGPCVVSTTVHNVKIRIQEQTQYPFANTIEFHLQPERDVEFSFYLRDPGWSTGTTISCRGAETRREGGYWVVTKKWKNGDSLRITFAPVVHEVSAVNGEVALQYGPLLFAQPIEAQKRVVKTYSVSGFEDAYFVPASSNTEEVTLPATERWSAYGFKPTQIADGDPLHPFDRAVIALEGTAVRQSDGSPVAIRLLPLGNTPTLRRVTFPVKP